MRKSADVVILMQLNSENIQLLFPRQINWEQWREYKPDVPFSGEVVGYLNRLATSLLKDPESRKYPDVVTFAFFCRKANLLELKKKYPDDSIRLGRGILFHIAPSNVPINFGYSLIVGLLSGNYNIVRVSSKIFPQVDLIVKHLYKISQEEGEQETARRIALVRYERTSEATSYFSSLCDVRVIWGGDGTIARIRESSIPSRAFDVTFADRYSLAVIKAEELLKEKDMKKLALGFYNDTYLFDQNACSAPHLIVWQGEEKEVRQAQLRFWEAVQEEVDRRYEFQPVMAVDKLTAFYRQAQGMSLKKIPTNSNNLVRVSLNELQRNIDEYRCVGGYFSEYIVSSLAEIVPVIKSKYQTMAYYGFSKDELEKFVLENRLIGIDRIVPIGNTTDFSLIWDGYDLINTLSRRCLL